MYRLQKDQIYFIIISDFNYFAYIVRTIAEETRIYIYIYGIRQFTYMHVGILYARQKTELSQAHRVFFWKKRD